MAKRLDEAHLDVMREMCGETATSDISRLAQALGPTVDEPAE